MIQSRLTINNKPVEGTLAFIEHYQAVFREELQTTHDEIEPYVIQDLEVTPGNVHYPIEWQSERQRRAFFATNGFGGGIPYQRTGKLALAWEFVVEGNSVVIRNRNPASPFVYGSLALSNQGAFKQRMHENTGWQTAGITADFWMREFQRQLVRNMSARLGESMGKVTSSRRGYTRTA
jgi:hypothetical protein